MCSLFGWIDYKGIVPHKVLEKLTQALANAAEERGTDAAGILHTNSDSESQQTLLQSWGIQEWQHKAIEVITIIIIHSTVMLILTLLLLIMVYCTTIPSFAETSICLILISKPTAISQYSS